MRARVGASGGGQRGLLPGHRDQGEEQLALDRPPAGLPLPAAEAGAVVLEGERIDVRGANVLRGGLERGIDDHDVCQSISSMIAIGAPSPARGPSRYKRV
jgi:hypothetical protein